MMMGLCYVQDEHIVEDTREKNILTHVFLKVLNLKVRSTPVPVGVRCQRPLDVRGGRGRW